MGGFHQVRSDAILTRTSAAPKPPESKRFAKFGDLQQARRRLECGGFGAAFAPACRPRADLFAARGLGGHGAFVIAALFLTWFAQLLCAQSQPLRSESYTWRNVTIKGGGFVTGIIFHPRQKDLVYARTDVGGAYRWDAAAKRWIPITDWIGVADVNLTGIESLALDPADAGRVYLAAGTYRGGAAAILRSDDQGRTFQRTDVPFRMGGNELGRFNGERLAVDPNQGEILYFGSRQDGLWRSADRGATWNKVESFRHPGAEPPIPGARPRFGGFSPQLSAGVVCVVFDPAGGISGRPTSVIYAAMSTIATNLFRSIDAGANWQPVPGQPLGLRPNHLVRAPDGIFYLSYGREPGPNTMTDGAVWKFDPSTGAWADITPVKPAPGNRNAVATGSRETEALPAIELARTNQPFGYGAVTVDAQDSSTIMVTTFCHWRPHDEIFRSTNGGANWAQLWQDDTEWDHSSAPYTETRTPHWMGDVEINPFDSDQVQFTTGYGIWRCVNATKADAGLPTRWVFHNDGLEETVPLALLSPPEGAPLLSGVGDIDGFVHNDLAVSPPQGSFAGPRFSNTEDLAIAGRNPGIIVRTGTGRAPVRAAISEDGGLSWRALGSEPPNSDGAGSIAVSADGRTIVWTPRRGAPHSTGDCGTNWIACGGLSAGLRVIADPVEAAWFYAYDARAGRLLVSTNRGASFRAAAARFPREAGDGGRFGGGDLVLSATPGVPGDLWLAFRKAGLHHSTDGGASFTALAGVQEPRSLGFGKAAAGRRYPALFLAGKVSGRQALFRSDDAGKNWVRINDDRHQFGWIDHVTGDPRRFGRVYFATGGRGIIYGEPVPDETPDGSPGSD